MFVYVSLCLHVGVMDGVLDHYNSDTIKNTDTEIRECRGLSVRKSPLIIGVTDNRLANNRI